MTDCLFCKIAAGDIPTAAIHECDEFLAFADINPQAPVHLLLIPRRHITALTDLDESDAGLMGRMLVTAARIAAQQGLDEKGYRWVINCGDDGCQSVPHLHLHILGGRQLGWPPG
jgi:histidine triad (HIT) family protein